MFVSRYFSRLLSAAEAARPAVWHRSTRALWSSRQRRVMASPASLSLDFVILFLCTPDGVNFFMNKRARNHLAGSGGTSVAMHFGAWAAHKAPRRYLSSSLFLFFINQKLTTKSARVRYDVTMS